MENFGLLKFLKSPYPAASKNIAAPHPEKSPENAEKPPEKIYYIVEKKKKRESAKYAEPKEFRFK